MQVPEKADKAIAQYADFILHSPPFDSITIAKAKAMPAHKWWAAYGSNVPELAFVAMIVLASVTGAGEAERCWKKLDWIHTKRRNRLTHERATKLLRLSSALQLQRRTLATAGEEEYWGWSNSSEDEAE